MSNVRTDFVRLWLIQNRAGPANAPSYQSAWKGSRPELPRGDARIVQAPDPDRYGAFRVIEKIPGEEGAPSIGLQARYDFNLSKLLEIAKTGCDADVQVRMGKCADPTDSDRGWEKILVLEAVAPSGWTIPGDLNVFESGDRDQVLEELKFTGEELFEIVRMVYAEQAATNIVQEVVAVVICDYISCGDCDLPSDGCQRVFAVTVSEGGSPGLPAMVVFSDDQGTTWDDTMITTLAANENPTGAACVGSYLAVITNDGNALHYAPLADIIDGDEAWALIEGFNAAGEPNAIFSLSPLHTWVVGDGGYIYKLTDITAPVTADNVQDAGDATNEDLNDIHGYDELNLVAVGDNNAVVNTVDGGLTWAAVDGPSDGVNMLCVWMRTPSEWFVGDAGGHLWFTRNSGTTWTEKGFPASGTGAIRDIKFSNDTVGFLVHEKPDLAHPSVSRILRTVNGGYNWYVAPEGNTTVPVGQYFNSLAVCKYDANLVFAGGLAIDGLDGLLVKGKGT